MNNISNSDLFKSQFIEVLISKLHNKKQWVQELSKVLSLSIDAIYKKHRLESFYSLEEVILLSKHYSISLDNIINSTPNEVKMQILSKNLPINNISSYLDTLKLNFSKLQELHDYKVYYAARELPIFYYFLDQNLAYFKLFVFSKAIWKIPVFCENKFNLKLFDPEISRCMNALWALYSNSPSEEYWNNNIFDNTISQLKFYYDSRDISNTDALLVVHGMFNVIQKCKDMTIKGSKSPVSSNNFQLFENKILHTSNHILVRSNQFNVHYLTYDNPNYLITFDTNFIQHSIQWYDTIRENSYLLGIGSGHHTNSYFRELEEKVQQVEKYITNN